MNAIERRVRAVSETAYEKKRQTDFVVVDKGGRPPLPVADVKDKRYSLRLNDEQAGRLAKLAEYNTVPESTLVRVAVQHFLDNYADILGRK